MMRKRWTRKAKNKRNKQIIMYSLVGLMVLMVSGYAAFNTSLSLKAKGNIIKKTMTSETLKENFVDSGDGLYKDPYEEGRYIYRGTNPDNYITFNNEIWRIISVEADGTIKIIRNEGLDIMEFDIENSNVWETSDIKTYLNSTYLSAITNNQDKIVSHTWSVGAVTYNNSDLAGQIIDENEVQSQLASVGMITASEYLRTNINTEQCENMSINNTNRETCKKTNWMRNILSGSDNTWTISPYSGDIYNLICVEQYGVGGMSLYEAGRGSSILPVVYLLSSTTLSGTGSSIDPFVITN